MNFLHDDKMTNPPVDGDTSYLEAAADRRQQPFCGAILLFDGSGLSRQLKGYMRSDSVAEAMVQLMASIRANPLWYEMEGVSLVGRAAPEPMLAVFGRFAASELARWRGLALLIREGVHYHRHIDYGEVEAAAQRLADDLVSHYGREALSRFQFTGIPRGGVIVLGILSYLLDLRPDQIVVSSSELPHCETLVVVDDCSLSGFRFQGFLKQASAGRVIFCSLCAVPELCRLIERREPRVDACFNAIDLQDLGEARFGDAYPRWRDEQRALVGDSGYWVGVPQPVSFAWSEPQTLYWNSERGRFEAGWNLMPPHLCLKRRVQAKRLHARMSSGEQQGAVAFNDSGDGQLRAGGRVLWARAGAAISVARMPENSERAACFRLDGAAADMWEGLMMHGSIDGVVEALAGGYEVDAQVLRHDLEGFVESLMVNGLLTRGDAAQG